MSSTEFNANPRDIQFVLFEQIGLDRFRRMAPFAEMTAEDIRMVIEEAARLAREVTSKANAPGDREGCHFDAGRVTVPGPTRDAWHVYREGGWMGLTGDPEYGGQGLPQSLAVAVGEMFTGANCALSLYSLLTVGAAHILENFAPPDIKALYLPRMYAGEWTGTMGLTEANAGTDVGNLKTSARPNGDHYLLSGSKIFITGAEHDLAENIAHLMLARIEGDAPGTRGLSIFLVPKYRVNPDGSLGAFNDVRCTGIEHKLGIHASSTCSLSLGDDGDCRGLLLGKPGDGIRIMFHMMNEARIDCGVQGSAQASAAYLNALTYAKERIQSGHLVTGKDAAAPRVPIIEHPDVRRMLLEMKAYSEGMRSLLLTSALLVDASHHAPDELERRRAGALLALLTPICKAYCSDMGFHVCNQAVQTYGGYGYTCEFPAEQYLRDVRISAIYEGTNGVQAMDLLGRKLPMQDGQVATEYLKTMREFANGLEADAVLGPLGKRLAAAAEQVGKTSRLLLGKAGAGEVMMAFQSAVPLLYMWGELVLSYQLLSQAAIALPKLRAIEAKAGATTPEACRKLQEVNPDAQFYAGKGHAAAYFIQRVLPNVYARAEAIATHDTSSLDAVL